MRDQGGKLRFELTGQYFGWEFPQPNRIAEIQGETPEIGVKSLGTHESVLNFSVQTYVPRESMSPLSTKSYSEIST